MYRYVFKRVKETFEFGVNARKSYACQQASSIKYRNPNERILQQQQQRQIVEYQEVNFLVPTEHQQKRYEDFKRKYNCKHPNNRNPLLHAITWSTALVAGFYASQLLCLYRRNHRLEPKKCFYARYLNYSQKYPQQQSVVPSSKSKPICPLQKLLARKRSSRAAAAAQRSSSAAAARNKQQLRVIEEDDDTFGIRRGFETFGLFDRRFDKFYDNFGDTSSYRRVVFNLSHDAVSTETLVESKEISSSSKSSVIDSSSSSNSPSSTSSVQSDDEAIDAILSNLSEVMTEMEFQLGVNCILHGHYDDAVEHFRMAASSNHASSLFNLALLYEQGLGVKKDKDIAFKLYKSAGELGHDKALFNQGIFHAKGIGGAKKSARIAQRFFEKSASLGNGDAIKALSMLLPDYKKTLSLEPEDFIVADIRETPSFLTIEKAAYQTNMRSIAVN